MKEESSNKKLITMAMLAALAYLFMVVGRVVIIPAVGFLKYDPKDIIIAIGGFIYGPLAAFMISAVVSFVEFLTVSSTGIIGLVMNVISTCAFVCPAAFIYKKNHTMKGATIGLGVGCIAMVAVMILWNYLITPIYMGYPREAIVKLIIPGFLPFNLIKSGLNAGLTLIIYKPVVTALRKSNLVAPSTDVDAARDSRFGYVFVSSVLLVTCVLSILVFKEII
ncbi:MAG: ECF transporter S component [Cellulosilyticum sp.]|nr:ECF transporter S component [Cellulosilyticum sp.]